MKIATAAYPLDLLPDWAAYAAKQRAWVTEAAGQGADLLVFPEYARMELAGLEGEAVSLDLEAGMKAASARTEWADQLALDHATEFGVHILTGSGPAYDPGAARPVNRASLIGPGTHYGHQDKQIMTRFERDPMHVVPGNPLRVFDTPVGRIGILICYDSEFPLLGRLLVEQGVEIILTPSCTEGLSGYSRVRIGAMARALEGQCVVVQSPTVGRAAWCPVVDQNTGAAAIYGPPDLGFPPTGIIAEGTLNTPGWTIAEIDRAAIARVRAEGAVFNHAHWPESARRAELFPNQGDLP